MGRRAQTYSTTNNQINKLRQEETARKKAIYYLTQVRSLMAGRKSRSIDRKITAIHSELYTRGNRKGKREKVRERELLLVVRF